MKLHTLTTPDELANQRPVIAIMATDYLGGIKAEVSYASSESAMTEVRRLIDVPDTKVYLYNTTFEGTRTGEPFALVSKESGYMEHPTRDVEEDN